MIKALIILAILTIVSYALYKLNVNAMTPIEILTAKRYGVFPNGVRIWAVITFLLAIATVVAIIVTVIRW